MRIVHISDPHWGFEEYPEADIYCITGDCLANYPKIDNRSDLERGFSGYRRIIDPEHERWMQFTACMKLSETQFPKGVGFRSYLGSPDAPILCVRGNHDFIDLKHLFKGCNLVHEFIDNETIELFGHTFTGHRGIPWIYGNWNDEMARPDLIDRVRRMPVADVYMTHYPPHGLELDGESGTYYGLDGMLGIMLGKSFSDRLISARTKLHLFGHIHECGGRSEVANDILFSQAATTYNVLEGSKHEGWTHIRED